MKTCEAPNCTSPARRNCLCSLHYSRWKRHGKKGLAEIFYCKCCGTEVSFRVYFGTQLCSACYGERYYQDNKNKWLDSKERRAEDIKEYSREYYANNRDRLLQKDKEYWAKQENKKRRNKRHREYRKRREAEDPSYRLKRILRNRLHAALSGRVKGGSAVKDLGCSIAELRVYLEAQFYDNPRTGEPMTWNNHTHGGWNVDHIVPLCAFDLTNPEQVKKACHYTNLRPLWETDNYSKAAKDKICAKSI